MSRITSRFGMRTTALEAVEGLDLTGLKAIVTGASAGLGVETAGALAVAGAEVVLAVRDPAAGERVAASIAGNAPRGRTVVDRLDLADLDSVRAFVGRHAGAPLNILVNNAGFMACPPQKTAQGFEMQIGVNHLGHFVLATGLVDALASGAKAAGRGSRVVAVSSTGHVISDTDLDDPFFERQPYDKWVSYGRSKTANVQFAVGFTRRFADRGVFANALMPGGIMTELQRHLPTEEMIAFGWVDENGKVNDRFKTIEQGASTSVWVATAPELEGVGGRYFEDCAEAEITGPEVRHRGVRAYALDPDKAEALWAWSERTVG